MRTRTALATSVAALALIGAPAAIASGGGANPDHVTVVDGADRYATAAQVALNTGAPHSTQVLYIANGETLVDAVVATFAADEDRKILLVRRDEVPAATADALRETRHAELVFLGGDDAISPAVREEVASLTDNYAHPN